MVGTVALALATLAVPGVAVAAPAGLVAAYSMDQGAGSALPDLSGNGNAGTIGTATWAQAGRYGGALSFNGSTALVTVPDADSLDLSSGMTTEAWVNPTTLANTPRTVVSKARAAGSAYSLLAHGAAKSKVPSVRVSTTSDQTVAGTSTLPTGAWTHLAGTYDGAALRLYVNGTQVAERAVSGPVTTSTGALTIGGSAVLGQHFKGLIDEVRIYDRALAPSEIQTDMATPVGSPDTQPPTAPQNLTASGSLTSVQLSWSASTDNTGVVRYGVHRSTSSGFTPSASNRVATTTTTGFTDAGLAAGTYYYRVVAEDAAGHVSAPSNEASARVGDTAPPSAPGTLSATGGVGGATLSWGAATDDVGVARYHVHRSATSGFTPSAANRVATATGLSYAEAGLAPGSYFYRVVAEDAAGNLGPASNEAIAVVRADTAAAVRPRRPLRRRVRHDDHPRLVGFDRRRRRGGLRRPPVDEQRFHPLGHEPDRAADRDDVRRRRPRGGHLLLQGGRARRGSEPEHAVGRGERDRGRHAVARPRGRLRLLRGQRHDHGGLDRERQHRLADRRRLDDGREIRECAVLQRHLLARHGRRQRLAAAGRRDDVRGLGQAGDGQRLAHRRLQGALGWYAGVLYAATDTSRPSAHVYTVGDHEIRGPSPIPVGAWTHLAATYDGSSLAVWVNGVKVAATAVSGTIATGAGPLRIGGNGIWGEYFNGVIDEVRVYDRALTASAIQADMTRGVAPDVTPPSIVGRTPAPGAAGLNVGTAPTATFSEDMAPGSITSGTFTLADGAGTTVPASVTYDVAKAVATITPQAALRYGVTYTVTAKGGSAGMTDLAGNPLPADVRWSFATEASPPQVLVVASPANPYGSYLTEILRNEGLNAFTTLNPAFLSAAQLSTFDVVVLGETQLTAGQVSLLGDWVAAGGNLVAMRPDKQLAGLLGLSDAGATLSNGYLKVDTAAAPGAGIVGTTIQYHGTADRYTLAGATAVASLYANATTATSNPAVTLRSVGTAGGQAAAFTYDLARSVVLTRQGNPAWAGQERDGVLAIRPDDMFYGAKVGDLQTDWLDTSRIAIPQADEQQRLLMNLLTLMERDRMPLPRFWYLPRGAKAAVVLSGDDHSPVNSPGYSAPNFDHMKSLSPAGCVVGNWQCVRSTAFVYPAATLTDAQAKAYVAEGFDVALHPQVGSCPSAAPDPADMAAAFDLQLGQWAQHYPSLPAPVSNRTHCVVWPDWASEPKIELARGMRLDANYYHYPASWIGAKPGFLNGGGFPMRFADLDGTPIDVYQQNTNMNDEAGQSYPATVNALLDNAVGAAGFYGAFGVNIHYDYQAPQAANTAIVQSAQARGVPLVSYKQMLQWVDGRNASTIRSMSWSAGTFTFTTTVGLGAAGLQTLLPVQGPTGTLTSVSCGGSTVPFTRWTMKGIEYGSFTTVTGTCQARYG